MKTGRLAVLMVGVLCIGLVVGCSSAEGECTYDTDCPQICYICDTTVHRCVKDLACESIQRGECRDADDCDPINEYCDVPFGEDVGLCQPRDRPDGGPKPDSNDGGPVTDNPACNNPSLDCSGPGLQGQGMDRDGDLWGECCDCDDLDSTVHPNHNELIYNCKDDDCDAASPDGDLDGDGYISQSRICDAGPDCDDRDASVYPGAPEVCDGKDNDCNGPIDDGDVCVNPDGGPHTDGDLPAPCPDLSGSYHIEANCMAINDADSEITQDSCQISINFSGIGCNGSVDSGMNLYIECAGIPVACTAKVSLTSGFLIICSQECTFYFTPVDEGTDCTYHDDPACIQSGQLCGIVGKDGIPETKCVNTVPEGRQPGYYCDANWDIHCINSLCINNYCSAICTGDHHCSSFPGMDCQQLMYDDGQGTTGQIDACGPTFQGETRCDRTPDCPLSRVCSFRALQDDVITVCRSPNPGGATAGAPCTQSSDCENNLCVCNDRLCDGESGVCSEVCASGSDCLQGYACGAVNVQDLQSGNHMISACIRDSSSCGRDADCPSGKCCQLFIGADGQSLDSICYWGGGQGEPNTGEECTDGNECCSVQCFDYPSFCLGMCIGDTDCPVWDAGSCSDDSDCDTGYLCYGSTCQRKFLCSTFPFVVGYDMFFEPYIDTANICIPDRRICQLNEDCREPVESCKLYFNSAATQALYQCEQGGPGSGQNGDPCDQGGNSACWSSLCLLYDGGGPGKQFCSEACTQDEDCGNVGVYYCATIQVDVRPGFVSFVPACAKRDI